VLPNLIKHVFVHETKDMLIDIGSPEAYQLANVAYPKSPAISEAIK